jgi:putative FmdB family regulatory protein
LPLKDFKCDKCGKEFDEVVSIKDPNPKCECGGDTHWLPKPNEYGHQIKYSLRVLCNGFSDKISNQRIV